MSERDIVRVTFLAERLRRNPKTAFRVVKREKVRSWKKEMLTDGGVQLVAVISSSDAGRLIAKYTEAANTAKFILESEAKLK